MSLNYSQLYNAFMSAHALLPYTFGNGYAFPPLRISFMVTYKCNLHCQMCFQREWRSQHKSENELSFDEIIHVIEQTPRVTLLTWTGGEPFVRPDMVEIIRYAARRNPCNILTNATRLDAEAVQTIVESGVRLVGISIDGIDEVHDAIRGRRGCFQETLSGIRRIQDYKERRNSRFPLVDIKTMILPNNVFQLRQILDVALQVGADFFTLSLPFSDLQFSPYPRQELAAIMEPVQTRETIDTDLLLQQLHYINENRQRIFIRFYPSIDSEEVIHYYRNQVDLAGYKPCRLPWSHLWISPTGQVFPCLSYEIGNIRTSRPSQLWNNERFRAFRQAIKHEGVVPSCVGCCYLEQQRKAERRQAVTASTAPSSKKAAPRPGTSC